MHAVATDGVCTCLNGVPATCIVIDNENCENCNNGFVLVTYDQIFTKKLKKCIPSYTCVCPNGTPWTTELCHTSPARDSENNCPCTMNDLQSCRDCHSGYVANGPRTKCCLKNVCPGGTPIGFDCKATATATTQCSECNFHYVLQSTKKCILNCSAGFHEDSSSSNNKPCRENVCTCNNGTGTTGSACPTNGASKCTSCNSGFHLSSKGKCQQNVCKCDNGTAVSIGSCATHEANNCTSCNDGYHLETARCLINKCTCINGGAAVKDGPECVTHGTNNCSSSKEKDSVNEVGGKQNSASFSLLFESGNSSNSRVGNVQKITEGGASIVLKLFTTTTDEKVRRVFCYSTLENDDYDNDNDNWPEVALKPYSSYVVSLEFVVQLGDSSTMLRLRAPANRNNSQPFSRRAFLTCSLLSTTTTTTTTTTITAASTISSFSKAVYPMLIVNKVTPIFGQVQTKLVLKDAADNGGNGGNAGAKFVSLPGLSNNGVLEIITGGKKWIKLIGHSAVSGRAFFGRGSTSVTLIATTPSIQEDLVLEALEGSDERQVIVQLPSFETACGTDETTEICFYSLRITNRGEDKRYGVGGTFDCPPDRGSVCFAPPMDTTDATGDTSLLTVGTTPFSNGVLTYHSVRYVIFSLSLNILELIFLFN
jgi:hypothetical protein